jgi:hypothetical protein
VLALALLGSASWSGVCLGQMGGTQGGGQTASASSGGGGASAATQPNTFGGSSTGAGAGAAGGGAGAQGLNAPAFTQFGQAGANVGAGFVGRATSEQGFIGQSAAGQQTIDAGGTARFSGQGGGGGGGAPQADVSQARGGQMRIARRIAFEAPAIPPTTLQTSLQTQFAALQSHLPGVLASSTAPGIVVLQGTVASEHERRLAEAVARLEPGVRTVANQLVVATPGPMLTPPQPTR